ncbi:hypothetical protein Tco_1012209 [Tanacetum coccineum]
MDIGDTSGSNNDSVNGLDGDKYLMFHQWDDVMLLFFTLDMNSVSTDVYMGLVYFVDAATVWKDLEINAQLLMGLDDCYRSVRSSLLISDPLSEEHLKMEMEIPCSNKIKFITACSFSNDSFEDIMKAQVSVIKASATLNIQAFKIKKSVSISFRMTQVHKMAKDHMMMIRDYDWMMISKKLKDHIQVKLKPKSLKFTASDSQDTDQ